MLLLVVLLVLVFTVPAVQTGIAKVVTSQLNKKYNTDIVVKKVDLSYLGNVQLKEIEIKDHHQDSLIYVANLTTSIFSYQNIIENKLEFGDISIEGLHFIMKKYEGEKDDNFSIFINKFDSGKEKKSTFLLTAPKINLSDAHFYLYDENKQKQPIVFYKNIKGTVHDFKLEDSNMFADIEQVSLIDDHGIEVTNLTTHFTYTRSKMVFENTILETENSIVEATVVFDYKREDLADFVNKVKINADFTKANVSLVDLHRFYDELGTKDKLNFTTKVQGTLNDFTLQHLKLKSNRNSTINGDFHFINAITRENGFSLNSTIQSLSSDYESLKQLLPNILGNTLPSTFAKLGRFTITGQSYITKELVNAKLTIHSALGKTISDLKMTNIDDIDNARYTGKVEFVDLDFGKIVQDSLIGKLSFVADVDGKGFTLEKINTSFKGNISKHQYKGYTYSDIDVNGVFKNQHFDGSMSVRDKNLKMKFEGLADLSSKDYKFDFIADVEFANFNKLNLFKRDSIAKLKGVIAIKITGNTIDNLAGKINFFNASYTNQNDHYFFKNFNVTSSFKDRVRTLTMNSTDIIDGKVKGIFKVKDLRKLATNSLGSIYANYQPTRVSKGQYLDFNFKIYNKIVDVFFPEVKIGANSTIKGKINSDDEKFKLTIKSPKIEAYENLMENLHLQIDNKNPLYNTLLSVDKVNTKYYNIADLNLINVTLNDTLFFRTEFIGGEGLEEKYDLSFYHTLNENRMSVVGLKKSTINIKGNDWVVNPTNNNQNKVIFDATFNTFALDKTKAIFDNQVIDIAGIISKNNKDLTLNLQNVKLEGITPFIENFKLKGLVNGDVNYKQISGDAFPIANLSINKLNVNDLDQGDLFITAKGEKSIKKYEVELKVVNNRINSLLINGSVDISTKKPTIQAKYKVDQFNLETLNPLGRDVINHIRGQISGKGTISGIIENPDLNGYMYLEKAGIAIPYLNVDYDFMGKPKILLSNQTFKVVGATLLDHVHDTEGLLSGSVTHQNFKKWFLDLSIDTNNLLVLNTTEQEDMPYYGTAFMDGGATIKGYSDQLTIDVIGKTNYGTEFIIPLSDVSTIGDSKLVNFITNVKKPSKNNNLQEVIFEKFKGLTLNFDLNATENAIVEIVVDKETGSVLRGRGNGYLGIAINTNGKFEMYGTYIVSSGVYKFRNIAATKDFRVQPGGQVIWTGNPFDAYININTVYKTKANPSALLDNVGGSSGRSTRKIDVDLIAKITGQLLDSEMEFDIKLPKSSSIVNSELQFKLNNQDTKMTQFFSLLISGSFRDTNEGAGFDSNAIVTGTVSEKINSVLSNLTKGSNEKFQFGLTYDLASRNDIDNYELDDQLGISVSTKLTDKLIINGRAYVPVGSRTKANVIGEVEAELPINKEGTLNLKGYTRQNDIEYDVSEAEGYTSGIGLSWRVDFDTAKELIAKIFKNKQRKRVKKIDSIPVEKKLINFIIKEKDSLQK